MKEYVNVLLEGCAIEWEDLSISPVVKKPNSGWVMETRYQVYFYDKYKDFELSKIFSDPINAVSFYLELLNTISVLDHEGKRIKSKTKQYERIYSYEPSKKGNLYLRQKHRQENYDRRKKNES